MKARDVIDAARQVAADHPDHVYDGAGVSERCVYRYESGDPGCIMGWAMHRLGALDKITDANNNDSIEVVCDTLGIVGHDAEIHWLTWVQEAQDKDLPWSTAIEHADQMLDIEGAAS